MNTAVMNDAKQCRTCGVDLPEHSAQPRCERCLASERLLLSHLSGPSPSTLSGPNASIEEAGTDFGDYVLLNEIARGGMGLVHRARQKSLNRIVAIKRPLPGIEADEECVRRFRIEAEAVAALSHPNIVQVFESGEWEGEQFFSMAYVEGEPLSEVIRTRTIGSLQAARYVQKIARAIHHAHQRGVLHRDLKPGNIIIDLADEPRVADFGIARLLGSARGEMDGIVVGTASYMAPEQLDPKSGTVSVATDVYALGGILYHLLAGHPPFCGENRERVQWAVYYEEPLPPSERNKTLSKDIEAVCLKALKKDPARRYASAQEMADDLQRFLENRPVTALPASLPKRVRMWVQRNPIVATLLIWLVLALAAAAINQWLAMKKIRAARADSEGLIGFMNQDLARDLREIGRLDLMEKLNARAAVYYASHSALGDDGFWERKARFFENSAAVEKDLGELRRAEAQAAETEKIYEEQHLRQPMDPKWRRNQSRVRTLRLNIAKDTGLRRIAEQHGEAATVFARAAVELGPSDPINQANFANVLLEQASFWISEKRIESPATNITRAEALLKDAVTSSGADPEWSLWLANCAYYRGRIEVLRRDFERALVEFTDYLAMVHSLVGKHSQNIRWQFELTVAYSRVGDVYLMLGQFESARSYFELYESSARQLVQADTRNANWLALYAQSLSWQGYLAKPDDQNSGKARDYFHAALVIQSNLVYRNPDWERVLDDMARTTSELGRWHRKQGQNDAAISLANQWREQCRERALGKPEHSGHQLRWGKAIVAEGELRGRILGQEQQVEWLQRSLAELSGHAPTQTVALAKARVLSGLANVLDANGAPDSAASHLLQALELRLGLFEQSRYMAGLRDQIPDNFDYTVLYHVRSSQLNKAVELAERGLDWAGTYLYGEEARLEFARMCLHLTRATSNHDGVLLEKVRRVIQRCVTERLA